LQTYPDYNADRLSNSPQRRIPQRIYAATKRIATTANLWRVVTGDGRSGRHSVSIPKQGVEDFWNHVLRFARRRLQRT